MNLRHGWVGFAPSAAVQADVARIEDLWSSARARFGAEGPWLFGSYSLADVFYAPIAARLAGYGLPISATAQAYVEAHLADTAFRQWRAMGETVAYAPMPYRVDAQEVPWPGPVMSGAHLGEGPSVNEVCPYSGDPVTHFLALNGTTYGFCNAFCRDKTLADPGAWPAFLELAGIS